jgi:hypothetical protein
MRSRDSSPSARLRRFGSLRSAISALLAQGIDSVVIVTLP